MFVNQDWVSLVSLPHISPASRILQPSGVIWRYEGLSALPSIIIISYPANLIHAPKSAPQTERAKAPVSGLLVQVIHRDTACAVVPASGPLIISNLFWAPSGSMPGVISS